MSKTAIKEVLIIVLCVLAASFGPMILINAKFESNFAVTGFVSALICLTVFTIVSNLISVIRRYIKLNLILHIISVVISILPFAALILPRADDIRVFEIDINAGFLNLTVIIVLGLVLFSVLYFRTKSMTATLLEVSMNYLFSMFLIFMLVPALPSSESKVILGNVAVIYLFIKTLISQVDNTARS